MSRKIKIGNIPLSQLSDNEVLEIALIENVHFHFEYWGQPQITRGNASLFSDTHVIDFVQYRIEDNLESKTVVFFLNFVDFSFHWHYRGKEQKIGRCGRLKIESIKYLIEKGYNVPL